MQEEEASLIFDMTHSIVTGPWHRSPSNPVNLSDFSAKIEQPIVTKLRDGSFVAVFDAIGHQGEGVIG
jgi:hypothetical protein